MKKFSIGALLILGLASVSQAQISRTFVGVNGNDANDCLAPGTACRTLNGAIGKVDAGGEVIVIETGSYAGATITKSVKINVPSGAVAFSALSLTITAGVNEVIVVRGMTMKALTPGDGHPLGGGMNPEGRRAPGTGPAEGSNQGGGADQTGGMGAQPARRAEAARELALRPQAPPFRGGRRAF